MTDEDRQLCEAAAEVLGWEWVPPWDAGDPFMFMPNEGWAIEPEFDPADPLADLEAAGRVLEAKFGPGCWTIFRKEEGFAALADHIVDDEYLSTHDEEDPNPLRAALRLVCAVKGRPR